MERSAKSVDELRQRQESLRSDLVAVVERELGGAPVASRAAAGGAAISADHEKDVEELRAHDLDHEERLLRQQAGMDELRAMLHAAAHLAQTQRAEIDILRGEVGSLQAAGEIDILRGELGSLRAGSSRGSDISSRTTGTSFHSAASTVTAVDGYGLHDSEWSRLVALESPGRGQFERQSAAGELRTTETSRASLPGTCMDVGHSTHEMNADI